MTSEVTAQHINTQTDEKLFQCSHCSCKFNSQHNLTVHQFIHRKKEVCNTQSQIQSTETSNSTAYNYSQAKKMHQCMFCSYTCKSLS